MGVPVGTAEYNGLLEALERKLYERFNECVDECRYLEAEQVARLMRSLGIV